MLEQLCKVLKENRIIPVHQSAYQRLHSTETAHWKNYDCVISACQDKPLLVLLGLPAAFDNVDHGILIEELFLCGIWDSALSLPNSCLED